MTENPTVYEPDCGSIWDHEEDDGDWEEQPESACDRVRTAVWLLDRMEERLAALALGHNCPF